MSQNNSNIHEFKPKLGQRKKLISIIFTIVRWIKISLSLGIFYGIYLLFISNFWAVQVVEINGISNIGFNYISKFDLEKTYKNKNLLLINPLDILKEIKHDRILKKIHIERSLFPAKLRFNFVERIPYVTVYEDLNHREVNLDEEGFVLTFTPKTKEKIIYHVQEIKNYKLTQDQMNIIKITYTFIKNKKISDIGIYNVSDVERIELQTKSNLIVLGNIESIIMKIKSIDELEKLSKKTKNELEYIDVSNWKNPVLKIKVKKKSESSKTEKKLTN